MRHLFTPIFALIVVVFMHQQSWASDITSQNQPDVAAIQQVLKIYIEGTSYNNRAQIAKAFHPAADLLLEKEARLLTKSRSLITLECLIQPIRENSMVV